MQYFSVPAAILEDGDALVAWAKQSVAIARSQGVKNPETAKTVRKRRLRVAGLKACATSRHSGGYRSSTSCVRSRQMWRSALRCVHRSAPWHLARWHLAPVRYVLKQTVSAPW
jgi:hypothetical protein